jgi:hypothetical protein
MATGYTRNDTLNNIANGNIIDANDLDGEFDAVQAAFDVTTGHNHDGTVGGGAPVEVIGPAQDIVVTATVLRPKTDNAVDLGTSTLEFKNLYLDGTANIDSLVADTADINGGTIDGATIATSDITVGSGKTLNVSAGTLTLANDQISGDKVEGGTINAITINTLGSTTGNITTVNATTVDTTNLEVTNLKAKDGTAAATIADATGVMTVASSVLTTTDINGGTVDATTIGATTPSTIAGTTGSFSGDLTIADKIVHSGDTNTAIRFPADDTVTVDTNGAERMRIDSAGNLGLGVTPSAWASGWRALQVGARSFLAQGGASDFVAGYNWYQGSGIANRYIVSGGANAYLMDGAHKWLTAPSGTAGNAITFTQAMTLDASGNLGVGTTGPDEVLHLFGSTSGPNIPRIKIEASGWSNHCRIERSAGSDGFYITNNYDTSASATDNSGAGTSGLQLARGFAALHTGSSGAFAERMRIDSSGNLLVGKTGTAYGTAGFAAFADGGFTATRSSDVLVGLNRLSTDGGILTLSKDGSTVGSIGSASGGIYFGSGFFGTERMRIDSAGNVGIGTTSPATPLHVNGTIRYTNRPAAGTITAIGFDANGDLKASSSSLRYKYDIEDYEKGIADVMQLRPVKFKFNGEGITNIGFIAEEVDALGMTEVMLYNENAEPEGISYANMVSLLTKAIQEQQATITALTARIEALENTQ